MEKLHPILNNIVREVDAIRGYIVDQVEDGDEIIVDECSHIVKLAAQLMKCMRPEAAAKIEDMADDAEEVADGKTDDDNTEEEAGEERR